MPSRKRIAGKTRRAKAPGQPRQPQWLDPQSQAVLKDEPSVVRLEQDLFQNGQLQKILDKQHQRRMLKLLLQNKEGTCDHGMPPMVKGDICFRYLNFFAAALDKVCTCSTPINALCGIFNAGAPDLGFLWKNEDVRGKMPPYLAAIGANLVLNGQDRKALVIALMLLMFQSEPNCGDGRVLMSDMLGDYMRNQNAGDAALLFRKGISCTCLDEICRQFKAKPKFGTCFQCKREDERKKMYLCSRCKTAQYCAPSCQRAHWKTHKNECQKCTWTD